VEVTAGEPLLRSAAGLPKLKLYEKKIVSMLRNEPKPHEKVEKEEIENSIGTLRRAKIAETEETRSTVSPSGRFQCSSTSRNC
jgi:hypothetical protein